jgi:hypothetical protein
MQLTNESKGSANGDAFTAGDVQVRALALTFPLAACTHARRTLLGVLSADKTDPEVLVVLEPMLARRGGTSTLCDPPVEFLFTVLSPVEFLFTVLSLIGAGAGAGEA